MRAKPPSVPFPPSPKVARIEKDVPLTKVVQGQRASDLEERFARALDKLGIPYIFQYIIPAFDGAPIANLPGEVHLDFVVLGDVIRPIAVDDSTFVHKGARKREEDLKDDIRTNAFFSQYGAAPCIRVRGDYLQTQEMADQWVRDHLMGANLVRTLNVSADPVRADGVPTGWTKQAAAEAPPIVYPVDNPAAPPQQDVVYDEIEEDTMRASELEKQIYTLNKEIEALQEQIAQQKALLAGLFREKAEVTRLAEITPDAGDIRAGRFLALSSGIEPALDGTGAFMSAEGETFEGHAYNIGSVNDGELQFGIDSETGKAIAGGGKVTLDVDGVSIIADPTQLTDKSSIKIKDPDTGDTLAYIGGYYSSYHRLDIVERCADPYLSIKSIGTTSGYGQVEINTGNNGGTGGCRLFGNGAQIGLYSPMTGEYESGIYFTYDRNAFAACRENASGGWNVVSLYPRARTVTGDTFIEREDTNGIIFVDSPSPVTLWIPETAVLDSDCFGRAPIRIVQIGDGPARVAHQDPTKIVYCKDWKRGTSGKYATMILTARVNFDEPEGYLFGDTAAVLDSPNTAVLLHFDGTHGSSTFTDLSGKTWTAVNATISSTDAKWLQSGYFNGTNAYIDTPDHSDFNFSQYSSFTIELWCKKTGGDGTRKVLCGQCNSLGSVSSVSIVIDIDTDNKPRVFLSDGTNLVSAKHQNTLTADGNWHHIAVVVQTHIQSPVAHIMLDGIMSSESASVTQINNSSNRFAIGRAGEYSSLYFQGYIDEFRFIKNTMITDIPVQPY